MVEDEDCSHYMKDFNTIKKSGRHARSGPLLKLIDENFSTLAFCKKWIQRLGFEQYYAPLKSLCDAGIIKPYPPLSDQPGCFTAQYEHTLILRPTCKEVISRGQDY